MASTAISQIVNQLAESVVLTEADDPSSLAQLHGFFDELQKQLEKEPDTVIPNGVTLKCMELAEQLILSELKQPQPVLDDLVMTVGLLQSLVNDEISPQEAIFPASLGLVDTSPTASEPAPIIALPIELPANVDESILSEFLSRQPGELEKLEKQVMDLEKDDKGSALDEIKRTIHTLKGETGLLGMVSICNLCHATEDAIANRRISDLIEPLLKIKDWLERIFGAYAGHHAPPEPVEEMLALLKNPTSSQNEKTQPTQDIEEEGDTSFSDPTLVAEFVTEAREHLDSAEAELLKIEEQPADEDTLNAIFRSFHTIKGVAGFIGLPDIQALAHISETVLDRARKHTLSLEGHALDVAFEAVDAMKRLIDRLQEALEAGQVPQPDPQLPGIIEKLRGLANPTESKVTTQTQATQTTQSIQAPIASNSEQVSPISKFGEILEKQIKVPAEKIQQAVHIQDSLRQSVPKLGQVLTTMCGVKEEQVNEALAIQQQSRSRQPESTPSKSVQVAETVKVDAPRLDRLVDAIGELVIAQAMLSQSALKNISGDAALMARNLSHLDKITRELQEMATSLRMIPVRSTFQKMARLARDVARKLNKQVNFVMEGEDTELDKTVVDRIGDPLVHMVRNALDHGLEDNSDERTSAGKPAVGTVSLRAYHKGGGICIEIQDDGHGLDEQVLRKKAIERGVIKESDQLTQQEIYQLIFAPGFSTAKQVTDVSGRGVGMDVVKRNIQALRGKIEIQSAKGVGSTFTIRLPLTLAIIEGMVVRLSTERYIIPTLSIVRMLQPGEVNIKSIMENGQALLVDDELIPLVRLDELFDVSGAVQDPTQATVVIVENSERKLAILTDALIGQQQIVIKTLGATMRGLPGIAGGAIMSDGRVGLVIDLSSLMSLSRKIRPRNLPLPEVEIERSDVGQRLAA